MLSSLHCTVWCLLYLTSVRGHSIVTVLFLSSNLELLMQTNSSRKSALASWSPNANWYGLIWFGRPEAVNSFSTNARFCQFEDNFWGIRKILRHFCLLNTLHVLLVSTPRQKVLTYLWRRRYCGCFNILRMVHLSKRSLPEPSFLSAI